MRSVNRNTSAFGVAAFDELSLIEPSRDSYNRYVYSFIRRVRKRGRTSFPVKKKNIPFAFRSRCRPDQLT